MTQFGHMIMNLKVPSHEGPNKVKNLGDHGGLIQYSVCTRKHFEWLLQVTVICEFLSADAMSQASDSQELAVDLLLRGWQQC